MRRLLVLLMALTTNSCAGPEPSDTGYVVLDPAARAAGLLVDTGDGAGPRSSSLPIPVSASEGATLIGDDLRAPLVVAPGETVEVTDARGTLVRGAARSDRLIVSGDRAQTEVLAQMLGAEVVTRDDGRLERDWQRVTISRSVIRCATTRAFSHRCSAPSARICCSICTTSTPTRSTSASNRATGLRASISRA